jgi:hypothetical protein
MQSDWKNGMLEYWWQERKQIILIVKKFLFFNFVHDNLTYYSITP